MKKTTALQEPLDQMILKKYVRMQIKDIRGKHFFKLSSLIGKPLGCIQNIEWNKSIEPSSPIAFKFEFSWLEIYPDGYNSLDLTWDKLNFNTLPKNYNDTTDCKWVKNALISDSYITHSKKDSTYSQSIIGKKLKNIELISNESGDFVAIILIFNSAILAIENRDEIFANDKYPSFYKQKNMTKIEI